MDNDCCHMPEVVLNLTASLMAAPKSISTLLPTQTVKEMQLSRLCPTYVTEMTPITSPTAHIMIQQRALNM